MNQNVSQDLLGGWIEQGEFEITGAERSTGIGHRLTVRHGDFDSAAFSQIDPDVLATSLEANAMISIGSTLYRIAPSFAAKFARAVGDFTRVAAFTATLQSQRRIVCVIAGDSADLSAAINAGLPADVEWFADTKLDDTRDFGRKVGGAAKDLAGLGEATIDLELLEILERSGEAEVYEAVTKEAIFRVPTLAELRADPDASPAAAYLFLICYRMIQRHPTRNPAHRSMFVRCVPPMLHTLAKSASPKEISCELDRFVYELGRSRRHIVGSRLPYFATELKYFVDGRRGRGREIDHLAEIEALPDRNAQWEYAARALSGPVRIRKPKLTATPTRPKRPLEELIRSGPPLDFSPSADEVRKRLGISGVELGNYVGKKEGLQLLNCAAEALFGLQHLLGAWVPKLCRSGGLSLALGARGKGGGCAHYEPGLRVINLTKLKGDGSLAHEFGHYLDHMLAVYAPIGASRYLSARSHDDARGGHPVFVAMLRAMRAVTHRSLCERVVGDPAPRRWYLERWMKSKGFDSKGSPQESFDRIADGCPKVFRDGRNAGSKATMLVNSIAKFTKCPVEIEIAYEARSNYFNSAKTLGVYWSRPEELFARAFETYVEDTLGWRDEFLVCGTKVDYFHARAQPYPQDDERARIVAAMEELMQACRETL